MANEILTIYMTGWQIVQIFNICSSVTVKMDNAVMKGWWMRYYIERDI